MAPIPMEKTDKVDIWIEGVKTIGAFHKRSLLDFVDMYLKQTTHSDTREKLSDIKRRIHNDLSQCCLSMGILMQTFRSGGTIEPFKDSMIESKPKFFKHRNDQNRDNSNKDTIKVGQSNASNK